MTSPHLLDPGIASKYPYLYSRLERQECVAGIAHLENATKTILGEIANLEDFQLWRNRAKIELVDKDIIDNDWRLLRFVQGSG